LIDDSAHGLYCAFVARWPCRHANDYGVAVHL
jgi:hypothetical protein